jgi:hypothetical protein
MFGQFGFKWEPTAIAEAIRLVLIAFALSGAIHLDDKVILAIVGAVSAVLSLFVRQSVTSQNTLEKAGTSQAAVVKAADDKDRSDRGLEPPIAPRNLMALLLAVGIGASLVGAAGCGKRYAPGTTVTQAMAYELDEGLKPLVATQGKVIAAVDAVCLPVGAPANPEQCKVLKPNADKFLKVVDQLMALVEKEVSPRLKHLDAAIVAVDAVRQGQLRAELVPFLGELSALTAKAFGTALPDGLVAKATTLAGKSIETFFQLRDAITELVNKIRGDAVGSMPSVPPTAAAQAF